MRTYPGFVPVAEGLFRVPAAEGPLSADVGLVETADGFWLYDVGQSPAACAAIAALPGRRTAVISHFHPDHAGNLPQVAAERVFVGANTFRYTGQGEIVSQPLIFKEGGRTLHLFLLPSSHAKGSLGLEVDGRWVFVGDGIYGTRRDGRLAFNAQLLYEQIRLLRGLDAVYCLQSHAEPFVVEKAAVLERLERLLALRRQNEPYIFPEM